MDRKTNPTGKVSTAEKCQAFRKLHEGGCFAIPNPWDIGSARYLQGLGFKALATTSSGFAWSKGLADMAITRELALKHLYELASASDLPLIADFENGFANIDQAGADVILVGRAECFLFMRAATTLGGTP
jgi:2-methylisocitrate lyase-like PEP mutase family enzyme